MATDRNSSTRISNVAMLKGNGAGSIVSIYPNPIKGKTLQLPLNNISKGNYTLSIINRNGQQMEQRSVNHNGGSATQSITLSKQLAAGMYGILLTGTDGKQLSMWFSVG